MGSLARKAERWEEQRWEKRQAGGSQSLGLQPPLTCHTQGSQEGTSLAEEGAGLPHPQAALCRARPSRILPDTEAGTRPLTSKAFPLRTVGGG